MSGRKFSTFTLCLSFVGMAALVLVTAQPAMAQWGEGPVLTPFAQEIPTFGGVGGIPVAVPDGVRKWRGPVTANHYTIDINQFTQTLHPDMPGPTTLWGYNPRTALGVVGVPTQKHLGGLIITQRNKPVQITFVDNLPNSHILPVDTTLMGADGAQNRVVTHLHGGFTPWISDGGPMAWWDPQGGQGESFINNTVLRPGQTVPANEAEFYYPNDSSARLEWYHDHALGITRLNAYAGLATGYVIRDTYESEVLIKLLGMPKYIENGGREMPIIIQDKVFLATDQPAYPGSAKTAGSMWYPYVYDPAIWTLNPGGLPLPVPSVVPEAFGDTTLVNGVAYPKATVDPRRYRLRILNACNARFMNLQIYEESTVTPGQPDFTKPVTFLVVGAEGGFLARPVNVVSAPLIVTVDPETGDRSVDPTAPGGALITAPAERWDVIVDFNGKGGKSFIMWNDAPAPYPGGNALFDFPRAGVNGDVQTLMRFDVRADSSSIPADPKLRINATLPMAGDRFSGIDRPLAGPNAAAAAGSLTWLTATTAALPVPTRAGVTERQVTLNEAFDEYGRLIQMQGNNVALTTLGDFSRPYLSTPTETPTAGTTEVWHIVNLTMDTHPIHVHLANAQILSRRPFDVAAYQATPVGVPATITYTGPARGPDAIELGWKETFKSNPGEVTTIIMKFTLPTTPFVVPVSPRTGGYEYVWHCHILDHEEHDMMRPLIVQP